MVFVRTALLIGLLVLGWAAFRTEGFAHTSPSVSQPAPPAALTVKPVQPAP